jgi:hypothetical protein
MNQFDIQRAADKSGFLTDTDNFSLKTAFWTIFSMNLESAKEDEMEDMFRKTERRNIWED